MRRLIDILIFAVVLIPSVASGKRGPAPKVDPVEYQGVRYTPHGDGRKQYVQASDIKTGKTLWDVTVFHTLIIPLLEEDVQWVFIKQMFVADGKLIAVAEDGRAYGIDVKNGVVTRLRQVPEKPQPKPDAPATAGSASRLLSRALGSAWLR